MRILCIQLKRIGDLALTTPALASLRDALPDCLLGLAAARANASLLPCIDVDETFILEGTPRDIPVLAAIMGRRWDACLDFSGTDRSMLLAALSRGSKRIAFERFRKRPLRSQVFNAFVDSSVRERHTADHYCDLLTPLDIHCEGVPPRIVPPRAALDTADRLIDELKLRQPLAALHAVPARPEKLWTSEGWAAVAQRLADRGFSVVFTGSENAEEHQAISKIIAGVQAPTARADGLLDLAGMAALLTRSKLVCSVDSAAVHLADAVGTPVVALFGPTDPRHWKPRGPGSRFLRAAPGEDGSRPMTNLETNDVLHAIDLALEDSR